MTDLGFISDEDFKKHIWLTMRNYRSRISSYDLEKFNSNIIDPIKLIFDSMVYGHSWEMVIKNEIIRQRDKSNNNDIGYFHQRIFQYMVGCIVPATGWDVIFSPKDGIALPSGDRVGTVYVEMKNKHNTMNSASSGKIYIKMQGQLLSDDDCACFLVETIAKHSQNIPWEVSVDGTRQKHRRIRRVSIDEFYRIVTGQTDAFYRMCMALPSVIEEVLDDASIPPLPSDTVMDELKALAEKESGTFALALYMLSFGSYHGFRKE